ncbi:MAG: hypothetical protein ACI8QZ_003821 [Chlamydiales bacterium]|jgi:hypothetical protein
MISNSILARTVTVATLAVCTSGLLAAPASAQLVGTASRVHRLSDEQLEILNHMSIVYLDDGQGGMVKTIQLTGVNFRIVDGSGSTDGATTGLGNLIVGYNELRGAADNRTGSHNIVGGRNNNFSSFGGLVAGEVNTISGSWSSVSGGTNNTASNTSATVSGGLSNLAGGPNSSISGGAYNYAGASSSSVSGGLGGSANADWSSVSGGYLNLATGDSSTVSGGYFNTASGLRATVSGGYGRAASNYDDWRGGSLFEEY